MKWTREKTGEHNGRPLYAYHSGDHRISTSVVVDRGMSFGRPYRRTRQEWYYKGRVFYSLKSAKAAVGES